MQHNIVFLRHAQSAANAGLPTTNHSTGPLTSLGEEQARIFASKLDFAPELLVVSSFKRAIDTAEPIRRRFPAAEYLVRPKLHEFTYLSPSRFNGSDASQREAAVRSFWDRMDPHFGEEDAESFAGFLERVRTELDFLAALPAQPTLVVSHSHFIHMAALLADKPELPLSALMPHYIETWRRTSLDNVATLTLDLSDWNATSS